MNNAHPGAGTGQKHRDIGVAGAFSIGIGGIVGGGIFATLGLAGSQARGATSCPSSLAASWRC
jgi:amino acid transporter